MADDRKSDEPFLQRWARRKADAAQVETEDRTSEDIPVQAAALDNAAPVPTDGEAPVQDQDGDSAEVDLSALPDVDSLDADSDFSGFMQEGVPEELQKRALQRLWRLDPSFGHIDGLLEYGEDFTGNGLVAEAVNTVYKVGKGMTSDDEEEDDAVPASDDTMQPSSSEDETDGTEHGRVSALRDDATSEDEEVENDSASDAVVTESSTQTSVSSKS